MSILRASFYQVLICIGSQSVNSIQFITNTDVQSSVFGCPYSDQKGTTCYTVSAPGGLLGLQGYADSIVKGINFVSNQPITFSKITTTRPKTTTALTKTTRPKTSTGTLLFNCIRMKWVGYFTIFFN